MRAGGFSLLFLETSREYTATSIIYTLTDEAPRLATASFLPIVRSFAALAGINVTESDISVAARVLGSFRST